MAATPLGTNNHVRTAAITQLFNEQLHPGFVTSFNTVRLLSLHRDPARGHREALFFSYLLPRSGEQEKLPNSTYQAFDIIARDLLLTGCNVPDVNSFYFARSPKKENVAIQIIQWCCDHQWGFQSSYNLIRDAIHLNEPELAFQILLKLIALPNTQIFSPEDVTSAKISAFTHYASDERVKKPINEFTQEWYAQHWESYPLHLKKNALSLFLRTNNHESFKLAFAELLDDPCMIWGENDELIEDLFKYGFEEEGNQLIQRILANDGHFLSSIYNEASFIDHAIKIDRETLISKVKAELESPTSSLRCWEKLNLIVALAPHRAETEEAYLMHQAALLYKAWEADESDELKFATLYFYLNQKELCHVHYHNYVDELLGKNGEAHAKFLNKFREMGLELNAIKDLKTRDSFEMIQLILQAKKNKK